MVNCRMVSRLAKQSDWHRTLGVKMADSALDALGENRSGDDVFDPLATMKKPLICSCRGWVFLLSMGLWSFAAWQVSLLPLWKPICIRYGYELPVLSRTLLFHVEPWMPITLGLLCTLVAMFAPWRWLRWSLVAIAFLGAFAAHMGNVFMPMKMHRMIIEGREERDIPGQAVPVK
jgi:hypothetical protein